MSDRRLKELPMIDESKFEWFKQKEKENRENRACERKREIQMADGKITAN